MTFDPVTYTRCLAKKMTNELGFIPAGRYEDALSQGTLLIQKLNEEPCGFLFFSKPKNGRIKVWQTAIQLDARRRAAASDLLDQLKLYATAKGASEITLRCRDDLEANAFWQAAGFHRYATSEGGQARGGIIFNYSLFLPQNQPQLFPMEPDPWQTPRPTTSRRMVVSKPLQLHSSKQLTFL